uniref:Uncharacterized protein n=1 Tax=Arundo donax TaxID=35708 RepID=A0A0A9HFR5_ARUDO
MDPLHEPIPPVGIRISNKQVWVFREVCRIAS